MSYEHYLEKSASYQEGGNQMKKSCESGSYSNAQALIKSLERKISLKDRKLKNYYCEKCKQQECDLIALECLHRVCEKCAEEGSGLQCLICLKQITVELYL